MDNKIQEFVIALASERKSSQNTLGAYRTDLRQLSTFLGKRNVTSWTAVTPEDISDFALYMRECRYATTSIARKVAAMKSLADHRGKRDPHGYVLRASAEAVADELACAAGLVCGKLNQTPFCIVRGFGYARARGTARELIRARENDLFR